MIGTDLINPILIREQEEQCSEKIETHFFVNVRFASSLGDISSVIEEIKIQPRLDVDLKLIVVD